MPELPRVSGEAAKRAFERAGFVHDRTRGSHHILKKEGNLYHLSIPIHGNKTLGTGLLKSLIAASGMTVDEFAALL